MEKENIEKIILYGGGKLVPVDQSVYCISGKRGSRKVLPKLTSLIDGQLVTRKIKANIVDEKWVFDALSFGKLPNPKKYSIDYEKLEEEDKKKTKEMLQQIKKEREQRLSENEGESKPKPKPKRKRRPSGEEDQVTTSESEDDDDKDEDFRISKEEEEEEEEEVTSGVDEMEEEKNRKEIEYTNNKEK